MKTIIQSTLFKSSLLIAAITLTGCSEAKEKTEKTVEDVTGYTTIKQGEKARQALQKASDERNSELEAISGNP